jgi:hypothetical protein
VTCDNIILSRHELSLVLVSGDHLGNLSREEDPENMVSQQYGLSAIWSLSNMVSQQYGLSAIWSLSNMVSQQYGLSYNTIRVIIQYGGNAIILLELWPLTNMSLSG